MWRVGKIRNQRLHRRIILTKMRKALFIMAVSLFSLLNRRRMPSRFSLFSLLNRRRIFSRRKHFRRNRLSKLQ